MPPAVLATAVLAIATLPLAGALRPPRAVQDHDLRVCVLLGAAGVSALAAALALALVGAFWPGIAAFGVGLVVLHLTFWCAGGVREDPGTDDADDSGGGGGGQRRREPRRPLDPGGSGLDWDAFDRERARWEAERRTPALG